MRQGIHKYENLEDSLINSIIYLEDFYQNRLTSNFIDRILDSLVFNLYEVEKAHDKYFWTILKILSSLGLINISIKYLKIIKRLTYIFLFINFNSFVINNLFKNLTIIPRSENKPSSLKFYKHIENILILAVSLYNLLKFLNEDYIIYPHEYNIVKNLILLLKENKNLQFITLCILGVILLIINNIKNNRIKKTKSTDNILIKKFEELYFNILYIYFLIIGLVIVGIILMSKFYVTTLIFYNFLKIFLGNRVDTLPRFI